MLILLCKEIDLSAWQFELLFLFLVFKFDFVIKQEKKYLLNFKIFSIRVITFFIWKNFSLRLKKKFFFVWTIFLKYDRQAKNKINLRKTFYCNWKKIYESLIILFNHKFEKNKNEKNRKKFRIILFSLLFIKIIFCFSYLLFFYQFNLFLLKLRMLRIGKSLSL